jgi:D-3-phosphoglycerate dehydrogenase / 2-oxoglutarate reductase
MADSRLAERSSRILRVIAIDHRFGDTAIEQKVLDRISAQVIDAATMDAATAAAACVDADGILVGPRLRFDKGRLASLRQCRIIVRYGVGVDNIDLGAAADLGIIVANVPDYCVEEVATHALAMILTLNRDLPSLDRSVREGKWQIGQRTDIRRLSEATLGIAGFGRIGEALARRALALGMTVVASDPMRPRSDIEAVGARHVSLNELLEVSDFISIHASKGQGAGAVLDADAVQRLKPGAYVVNVSRGGLVDEIALAQALVDGRLAGAALDVTDEEPVPPSAAILSAPNLIVTPHVAWYSLTAVAELRRKAAEEVARVLGGDLPTNVVVR